VRLRIESLLTVKGKLFGSLFHSADGPNIGASIHFTWETRENRPVLYET